MMLNRGRHPVTCQPCSSSARGPLSARDQRLKGRVNGSGQGRCNLVDRNPPCRSRPIRRHRLSKRPDVSSCSMPWFRDPAKNGCNVPNSVVAMASAFDAKSVVLVSISERLLATEAANRLFLSGLAALRSKTTIDCRIAVPKPVVCDTTCNSAAASDQEDRTTRLAKV